MCSNIRTATVEDLASLEPLAREFYASSQVLKRFDTDLFVTTWIRLLDANGVIFLLEDNAGVISGALGGVIYGDPYSGDAIATEFFWFVSAKARGGRGGLQLLQAFEGWARDRGALEIRMVHLLDSMPEKLARVYKHFGFQPIEVHYSKELA
jgi:GNAT superfamily N-acetyltransferase